MKITATYVISEENRHRPASAIRLDLLGPLSTGTEQANYQLAAEEKEKLRLRLVDVEVE